MNLVPAAGLESARFLEGQASVISRHASVTPVSLVFCLVEWGLGIAIAANHSAIADRPIVAVSVDVIAHKRDFFVLPQGKCADVTTPTVAFQQITPRSINPTKGAGMLDIGLSLHPIEVGLALKRAENAPLVRGAITVGVSAKRTLGRYPFFRQSSCSPSELCRHERSFALIQSLQRFLQGSEIATIGEIADLTTLDEASERERRDAKMRSYLFDRFIGAKKLPQFGNISSIKALPASAAHGAKPHESAINVHSAADSS